MEFAYRLATATSAYLQVVLTAGEGPLDTKEYRITLEAVPLEAERTFLHFTYTYSADLVARLAMQAYLGTLGAHKVGFTVVGNDSDGKPEYVAGPRGADRYPRQLREMDEREYLSVKRREYERQRAVPEASRRK